MEKKEYLGFWTANNCSTRNIKPVIDTNFRRLKKNLREICSGNVFSGNYGIVSILNDDVEVYRGIVK